MRKVVLFFAFLMAATLPGYTQELNVKFTINADQVQTTDRAVFKDMERAFANFMNSRKWGNDTYKNYEKINCRIFINISKMPSIGNFTSSAQITVARPVFNTNYESVLLNFADREFEFEYIESQPLDYNDNTYFNNITSMLAFYAYIILGVDADSFSDMGGNPYFQKALTVVNNAQGSNRPGWDALGSNRSRYALIESLNNPQTVDLRKGIYKYHRLALDTFEKNPEDSRIMILDVLKAVKKVWTINPSSVFVVSFFDSKANELANLFSDGSLPVRREAFDLLTQLDPKRNIYQKIVAN